jgi:hypothetical protein
MNYSVSIDVANVAHISLIFILGLLLVSELGKGIDDDTEQDVDHRNDNDDMEGAIEGEFHKVPIICNHYRDVYKLTLPCCHM